MIDYRLTETDRAHLARTREQALIARRHARDVDENEAELPPDVLPEAEEYFADLAPLPEVGPEDTQGPVMMLLQAMAANWGDYSVRLRRPTSGGLGNAALGAAGTEEQKVRWGGMLLSMAITEPGCGSDPSRVSTTAVLDEATDEWVINGEKIFVTTGIRAQGVVIWATIDKSAGAPASSRSWSRRARPASRCRTRRRSSGSERTTRRRTCSATAGFRGRTCSGSTSRSRRRAQAASAAS